MEKKQYIWPLGGDGWGAVSDTMMEVNKVLEIMNDFKHKFYLTIFDISIHSFLNKTINQLLEYKEEKIDI
jgi:hypothetical protein